jgi:beta-aspartyl-peptidase (threonine type)
MTNELEKAYKQCLEDALAIGYNVLDKGGSAIEAVTAAVVLMEDNELFNAGRGSVFTNDGAHEMDAAIMNGADLSAGAVAAVRSVRNPVLLACEVMQKSEHVLLSGTGALDFARKQNMKLEESDYFFSQFRYDQLKAAQDSGTIVLDHNSKQQVESLLKDKKFGTVGAVACDAAGNIAAATSTGGMTNKKWGRIGDCPVIGAGTYANNVTCAISCTGHGELFIRAVAAYDVSCLMEYMGLSLKEAAGIVVHQKLMKIGGEGGLIGVDATGEPVLSFNSEGMYRGVKSSNGLHEVYIYKN